MPRFPPSIQNAGVLAGLARRRREPHSKKKSGDHVQPLPFEQPRSRPANRISELVLTPVRQGMETRTDPRHHIENLLTGLAFAVSSRDRHLLAELTRGVQLRHGDGSSHPEPGPEEISAWLGEPAGHRDIIQTINTIGVYPLGDSVHYSATFQNWDVGPEPSCTSIGTYSGCLVSGPQVWRWAEHTINRTKNSQTRGQNPWNPQSGAAHEDGGPSTAPPPPSFRSGTYASLGSLPGASSISPTKPDTAKTPPEMATR